jgi:hypothetical protein
MFRLTPPNRYAAHGWLCTASRLRRRDACVAKPRLAPLAGEALDRLAALGNQGGLTRSRIAFVLNQA